MAAILKTIFEVKIFYLIIKNDMVLKTFSLIIKMAFLKVKNFSLTLKIKP
jgi:hypothetical protein